MFRFDKELPGNDCSYNEMSFDDLFHSCLFFFSSFFSFTIDSTVVSFNFSVWHFNVSVWQKEVPNSVSSHDKLWRILTINSIVSFLCCVWQSFLFKVSFPCFGFTKIFLAIFPCTIRWFLTISSTVASLNWRFKIHEI